MRKGFEVIGRTVVIKNGQIDLAGHLAKPLVDRRIASSTLP